MKTVYVVMGSRGEYSDRPDWPAIVFEDERSAPELINQIRKEEREKALDEAKAYFSGLVEDFLKKGEEMAITPDAEDCDDPIIKHGIWFSNAEAVKLSAAVAYAKFDQKTEG